MLRIVALTQTLVLSAVNIRINSNKRNPDFEMYYASLSPKGRYTENTMPQSVMDPSDDQFMYSYSRQGEGFVEHDYTGAFLLTRPRFIAACGNVSSWVQHYIEFNAFKLLPGLRAHMVPGTLDFFDFFVVHLSYLAATAEMADGDEDALPESQQHMRSYFEQTLDTSQPQYSTGSGLRKHTVALLPYGCSAKPGSAKQKNSELWFKATFWSLKKQFDAVVVGACNPSSQEFIAQLPAWKAVNLTGRFDTENCGMYLFDYARTWMQADSAEW